MRFRRAAVLVAFVTLTALLALPLGARHQYPDQDVPIGLALNDVARGGWSPATLLYPTALTNTLRATFAGWSAGDPSTLMTAWCTDPWRLRLVPRVLAAVAGVASLLAVFRLAGLAGGSGLLAVLLLGTSVGFVREHHHGMLDAPAAAAAMAAVWLAGRHVGIPSCRTAAAAGALAGLAVSFKYNVAPVALAVGVGMLIAPGARRRALVVASVGSVAAVLATSPAVVLQPMRLWSELATFAGRHEFALRQFAAEGNRLLAALRLGLGWPLLLLAIVGVAVALRRRMLVLLPLACFVVLYAAVLGRSPLVLNRYALPLAAPLAVFAAVGLLATGSLALRAAVLTIVVAGNVPELAAYLRLVTTEDTRVAAARWIVTELPAGEVLHLACGRFGAPDLPASALDPPFAGLPLPAACTRRRVLVPSYRPVGSAGELQQSYGHGVTITCDPPAESFSRFSTPAPTLRALERDGRLLAEFDPGMTPGRRVWEPFDQNYLPLAGAGTIRRPGPRIRLWRVPPSTLRPS
jgi:hypothetical protein